MLRTKLCTLTTYIKRQWKSLAPPFPWYPRTIAITLESQILKKQKESSGYCPGPAFLTHCTLLCTDILQGWNAKIYLISITVINNVAITSCSYLDIYVLIIFFPKNKYSSKYNCWDKDNDHLKFWHNKLLENN